MTKGEHEAKIVFAFCSPLLYLEPISFQQVPHERLTVLCYRLHRT